MSYEGYKRCNPHEELNALTKKRGTRKTFDTAKSELYMVSYFFNYKGEMLETKLSLPYSTDANSITLGGSKFNIAPILSDRVISIGVDDIFVKLLRDKLTFKRIGHHYMIDGKRETAQVAWSGVYHRNSKMKKLKATVKMNCSLMHYLLCKYGFTDTFKLFGNCNPVLGSDELITRELYPESEWCICSSTQLKVPGVGKGYYVPSVITIAIRKEEMTPMVKNMLGGFFYTVDHFTTRVHPSLEYVDSKRLWMVLLGHIIWSGTINEGKLYDDVNDHLTSLDEYLDSLIIYKLKDLGITIDNLYQLFAIIIENYNNWILDSADKVASMYDKELSILYYVLYEISSAIFNLYFKLKAASKKELTVKEITANLNSCLRTGLIYSITKSHHGEVSTITTSGDNKAFKATCLLRPQSESNRNGGRKDKAIINDPTKRLHVSVAEIGGYSNLPKSNPDGRSRINPCIKFDSKGVVLRDPKFKELLDDIQQKIS